MTGVAGVATSRVDDDFALEQGQFAESGRCRQLLLGVFDHGDDPAPAAHPVPACGQGMRLLTRCDGTASTLRSGDEASSPAGRHSKSAED